MSDQNEIQNSRIKQALDEILPEVDLETATQRMITGMVEEKLGVDEPLGSQYKPVIKEHIDTYLLSQAAVEDDQQPQEEEQHEDKEEQAEEPPTKKQKQDSDAGAVPKSENGYELAAKRFAQVRLYNKRPLVDVREYYEKDGVLTPGAKGLAMSPAQWQTLVQNLEALNHACGEQQDDFFVEIGSDKRASISNFKGRRMIDLREYYSAADGVKKPGKKGISLPPDQWMKLCAVHELLSADVAALGVGSGSSATPAARTSTGNANTTDQQQQQQPGANSGNAAGEGGGSGSIKLSENRRAEVSVWKGTVFCNIREYYEKDGQQLPGKKGISLTKEQFELVRSNVEEASAALEAKNTGFQVDLGKKRKLAITAFKGNHYVDMRDYYEKDGEMKPGAKGIALPEAQWKAFVAGLDGLTAALNAA